MKNSCLYIIVLSALFLLIPQTGEAQRKGRRPVKKKVEEPVEDPRITMMRASTQQVVFIDSCVVDRGSFMSHIPLSPHVGKLTQNAGLGTFTNEMGDHRLATGADSTIASSDFLANRWTTPQTIEGIGSSPAVNPFLMPDGITLYFAQKGEKSIGGFDIFVTRYDSEQGQFLRSENLGMPFASESDDLFYAVDEFNQLGYFVTSRRQPPGKVCIYVFIPPAVRRAYPSEAYSEQQLRSLASLQRIADTWGDGEQRREALDRLHRARQDSEKSLSASSQGQTSELESLRHQADVLKKALALTRNIYAQADERERQELRAQILGDEQQLEQLLLDIREKEKQTAYEQ